MARTNMPRHQTRIRNVIHKHNTTLIPLFDSAHWFLVEVNTDTRTFTFYNSAGRHGQQRWLLILKAWLIHHIHGPWAAAQGPAIQQPGTTECGTHPPQYHEAHPRSTLTRHILNTMEPQHANTHHQHNHILRLQPRP